MVTIAGKQQRHGLENLATRCKKRCPTTLDGLSSNSFLI
jgi:hypothetical protein